MTTFLANSTHLLRKCATLKHLKQIHAHLTTTSSSLLHLDSRLFGRLFTLAAESSATASDLRYATRLFSCLRHPTTSFFNSLIRACTKSTTPLASLSAYTQLLILGLSPDEYTFPLLVKACTTPSAHRQGRSIYGQVMKSGFDSLIYFKNDLIHFYSIFGCISDARLSFDCGQKLDAVSWNSMISGYARIGDMVVAKKCLMQCLREM